MNPTIVRIPFRFVLGSVLVLLLAASRPIGAAHRHIRLIHRTVESAKRIKSEHG